MFLTQKEYIETAVKLLNKYGVKKYSDEDVGYVVEYLMLADERFKRGSGNRNAFRVYYGRFAALNVINKKKRANMKRDRDKTLDFSIKSENKSHSFLDNIPSKEHTPEFYAIYKEVVNYIYNSKRISERNRSIMIDRFINLMSFKKLALKYNLSHQSIRNIINKVSKTVKEGMLL